MPRRHDSRFALAGRLAICALALGACAAPTAVPPTVAPTEPPTATTLPPTVAATLESTPVIQGPVPATYARLDNPAGIAFDADGNLYISECGLTHNILKVDRASQLTVFAGTGDYGFSGDGSSALGAQFNCPTGLQFDRDGNLYVSDRDNARIRRIDRKGIISTVAGGGTGGDGGPATSALLGCACDLALDGDGQAYIADAANNRVRRVDRQGIITSVAGSGDAPGFSGDGGPATEALLATANPIGFWLMGVAVDAEGNLYIADTYNYRIRKVDKQGIITTFAGNGQAGTSGDGGPATAASLTYPISMAFDNQGNLYFSEWLGAGIDNNRIREVDKNGIITTVAGIGARGFSGDGGPATLAALFDPSAIAFDQSGNMYIADSSNNRVRKVDENGIITTVVGGRS
jgi:DNA-binding beta-propeller fold protein YncE